MSGRRTQDVVSSLGRYLYTADEVAGALSMSTTMVRNLTLAGHLPCRRIGRLVRYSPRDVEVFVEALGQRDYEVRSVRCEDRDWGSARKERRR